MIDSVRNTVLSIISKDNRGYITPEEFNLFAKQAQMDIFENYFYQYGTALYLQNNRKHGSGLADVPFKLAEVIDTFIYSTVLHYNAITGKFYIPGTDPLFPFEPLAYKIDRVIYNDVIEIEKIPRTKILHLVNSPLLAPSTIYPVYTLDEQGLSVYPVSIINNATVEYVRYPTDPKWTYTSLSGGEPLFNQGATDYQDFELPLNDEVNLVVKILEYAGVSIREADVVQAAKADEIQDKQEKI
jgi:hypothetical protein